LQSYAGYGMSPTTFGGTSLLSSVDSVIFSTQKGLVPAIAFTTTSYVPDTSKTAVKNVNQAFQNFTIFPNPATDVVNGSVSFNDPAGVVSYTILNSAGQVVAKEKHTSVQLNDKYTYSTEKLANGSYYMVVSSNGKEMFKKFVVLR